MRYQNNYLIEKKQKLKKKCDVIRLDIQRLTTC